MFLFERFWNFFRHLYWMNFVEGVHQQLLQPLQRLLLQMKLQQQIVPKAMKRKNHF
jgi:hypothetical protein